MGCLWESASGSRKCKYLLLCKVGVDSIFEIKKKVAYGIEIR